MAKGWAAARLRLRSEVRTRRAGFVLLVAVIALTAGVAMAAAAGARRSDSAYGRFLLWAHDGEFVASGCRCTGEEIDGRFAQVRSAPFVEDSVRWGFAAVIPVLPGGLRASFLAFAPAVDYEDSIGRDLPRVRMVQGRLPDPGAPDEAGIGYLTAERFDLAVGDELTLLAWDDRGPYELETVRIVGIYVAPGELPAASGPQGNSFLLSGAFADAFPDQVQPVNDGVLLRLRPGTPPDEAEAFIRARGFDVNDSDNVTSGIERTIRIETLALVVLGLVVAAVGVVVVGQMLRRQGAAERDEGLTIAALGCDRGDDLRLGLLRGSVLGVAGAGLGVALAIAMSPLFPVGNGRVADPDIGLHADPVALGVGAALTVAVVTMLGLGAAAAALREGHRSRSRAGEPTRPWPMPATRPPMLVGLYFALPARSGQRRSPARASLLSLAIVVIVLATTAVTLASFDHLVERRDLAGATWQAVIVPPPGESGTVDMEASLATVRAVPGVDAATSGMWATTGEGPIPGIYVDGRMVGVQLFGDEGPIRPAISHGRAPAARGEVALGEKTLAALGLGIGDEVDLSLQPDGRSVRGRIVGEVVLASPGFFDFAPGTGAATVTSTLAALGAEEYPESTILVSYEDGADQLRTFNAVEDALRTYEAYEAADRQSVSGLGRIRLVPLLLLVGLFGLVAAAVAHVLLVSVAGHRRDVAVLRAMGFTKGQSRSSIAVHASLLALAACVIGIPLGVILGRIAWLAIAANLYVVPRPMAPVALLALLTAALVVVANVASLIPAARAVRPRPAAVLRAG